MWIYRMCLINKFVVTQKCGHSCPVDQIFPVISPSENRKRISDTWDVVDCSEMGDLGNVLPRRQSTSWDQ